SASTTTVPAPVYVRVEPLVPLAVAGPLMTEKTTGLEEAPPVAESNTAVPAYAAAGCVKLIVCCSGATYVYWSAALVALVPAGVVTVTSTAPAAAPAGAVAVIDVSLLTVKLVAAIAPKLTAVVPRKFVPVIVTTVPPASGPLLGETLMTVGGGVMPFPFNG